MKKITLLTCIFFLHALSMVAQSEVTLNLDSIVVNPGNCKAVKIDSEQLFYIFAQKEDDVSFYFSLSDNKEFADNTTINISFFKVGEEGQESLNVPLSLSSNKKTAFFTTNLTGVNSEVAYFMILTIKSGRNSYKLKDDLSIYRCTKAEKPIVDFSEYAEESHPQQLDKKDVILKITNSNNLKDWTYEWIADGKVTPISKEGSCTLKYEDFNDGNIHHIQLIGTTVRNEKSFTVTYDYYFQFPAPDNSHYSISIFSNVQHVINGRTVDVSFIITNDDSGEEYEENVIPNDAWKVVWMENGKEIDIENNKYQPNITGSAEKNVNISAKLVSYSNDSIDSNSLHFTVWPTPKHENFQPSVETTKEKPFWTINDNMEFSFKCTNRKSLKWKRIYEWKDNDGETNTIPDGESSFTIGNDDQDHHVALMLTILVPNYENEETAQDTLVSKEIIKEWYINFFEAENLTFTIGTDHSQNILSREKTEVYFQVNDSVRNGLPRGWDLKWAGNVEKNDTAFMFKASNTDTIKIDTLSAWLERKDNSNIKVKSDSLFFQVWPTPIVEIVSGFVDAGSTGSSEENKLFTTAEERKFEVKVKGDKEHWEYQWYDNDVLIPDSILPTFILRNDNLLHHIKLVVENKAYDEDFLKRSFDFWIHFYNNIEVHLSSDLQKTNVLSGENISLNFTVDNETMNKVPQGWVTEWSENVEILKSATGEDSLYVYTPKNDISVSMSDQVWIKVVLDGNNSIWYKDSIEYTVWPEIKEADFVIRGFEQDTIWSNKELLRFSVTSKGGNPNGWEYYVNGAWGKNARELKIENDEDPHIVEIKVKNSVNDMVLYERTFKSDVYFYKDYDVEIVKTISPDIIAGDSVTTEFLIWNKDDKTKTPVDIKHIQSKGWELTSNAHLDEATNSLSFKADTEKDTVAVKTTLHLLDSPIEERQDSLTFYVWEKPSLSTTMNGKDFPKTDKDNPIWTIEDLAFAAQTQGGREDGWLYEWKINGQSVENKSKADTLLTNDGKDYEVELFVYNVSREYKNLNKEGVRDTLFTSDTYRCYVSFFKADNYDLTIIPQHSKNILSKGTATMEFLLKDTGRDLTFSNEEHDKWTVKWSENVNEQNLFTAKENDGEDAEEEVVKVTLSINDVMSLSKDFTFIVWPEIAVMTEGFVKEGLPGLPASNEFWSEEESETLSVSMKGGNKDGWQIAWFDSSRPLEIGKDEYTLENDAQKHIMQLVVTNFVEEGNKIDTLFCNAYDCTVNFYEYFRVNLSAPDSTFNASDNTYNLVADSTLAITFEVKDRDGIVVHTNECPDNWTVGLSENIEDWIYHADDVDEETTKDVFVTISRNDNHQIMHADTIQVTIWPKPEAPSEEDAQMMAIDIKDENNNANNLSKGIRSGNKLDLPDITQNLKGGYKDGWSQTWQLDGEDITSNPVIPDLPEGTDTLTMALTCTLKNGYGNAVWDSTTYNVKKIKIYRRPDMPKSLKLKGNGTSHTWIVENDSTMNRHNAKLVIGKYISDNNITSRSSKDLNGEKTMWIRNEQVQTNDEICVYVVWDYGDDVLITSGLRRMQTRKEEWDGSTYTAQDAPDLNPQPQQTVSGNYTINGTRTNQLVKGLNIVVLENGEVIKVIKK